MLQSAREKSLAWDTAQDVQAVPGHGTQGQVAGLHLLLGSVRWVASFAHDNNVAWLAQAQALQSQGATVSVLAHQNAQGHVEALALLAFGDQPKPGVQDAIARLRARGLRLAMISGDNQAAALAMLQWLKEHPP